MYNYCILCGCEIPDDQLTCSLCANIVKELTPEQQRALDKLNSEEIARKQFRDAIHEVKVQIRRALEPACEAIVHLLDVVFSTLNKEGDE